MGGEPVHPAPPADSSGAGTRSSGPQASPRAPERPQARQGAILAEALRDEYFKDGGRRAGGLDVELNDVARMDVEL
ncbi:hypothetical protein [Kitasatospora xanthocidica]|uniref:hypothetical protein n=1 Tax=Kitasatospora xanthocidica TaxID=83382 RepID=UPI00167592A7|nr:hypothetical protein [Kitasatospora xanthocidica]